MTYIIAIDGQIPRDVSFVWRHDDRDSAMKEARRLALQFKVAVLVADVIGRFEPTIEYRVERNV